MRHVLLSRSLNPWSCTTLFFYLESIEHDYIRSLSLTSKCQVSVERIVLDLESEAMRGPGSMLTGGNILSVDFLFSRSKASDTVPILALSSSL